MNKILSVIFCISVCGVIWINSITFNKKSEIINVLESPNSTIIYSDDMNGANDTNALKSRGYLVYYRGTGPQGTSATWFQGNPNKFPAYNGPTNGYVSSDYNIVTGQNNIDCWLVFPKIQGGIYAGDSLFFYSRSEQGNPYADSIRVMYSETDSIPEGVWSEIGRFRAITSGLWERRGFKASDTSVSGRFAIRYCVVNGGPGGQNSDYIGIDAISIVRNFAPPPPSPFKQAHQWCSNYPNVPGGNIIWLSGHAAAILGDTMYVAGGGPSRNPSRVVYRYNIKSNTWDTGIALPTPKSWGSLVTCGNQLYYLGGSDSVYNIPDSLSYCYSPLTGKWTRKANIPIPVWGNGSACYKDSIIYILFGGPYLKNVQVYFPNSNTWSEATSLPGTYGRRGFASGIEGNRIYICGNVGTYQMPLIFGTINPSNPLLISWDSVANFPLQVTESSGTAYGGKLYVVSHSILNNMAIYDTTSHIWTVYGGKPFEVGEYDNGVTAKILNGGLKIFVTGGHLAGTRPMDVFADTCLILPNVVYNNSVTSFGFLLLQNYPNPFNPLTQIKYEITKKEFVTLIVFDILGKEIAKLVNEIKTPGKYIVDFDGSNLSSGIYFYQLRTGKFIETKKMVLLK